MAVVDTKDELGLSLDPLLVKADFSSDEDRDAPLKFRDPGPQGPSDSLLGHPRDAASGHDHRTLVDPGPPVTMDHPRRNPHNHPELVDPGQLVPLDHHPLDNPRDHPRGSPRGDPREDPDVGARRVIQKGPRAHEQQDSEDSSYDSDDDDPLIPMEGVPGYAAKAWGAPGDEPMIPVERGVAMDTGARPTPDDSSDPRFNDDPQRRDMGVTQRQPAGAPRGCYPHGDTRPPGGHPGNPSQSEQGYPHHPEGGRQGPPQGYQRGEHDYPHPPRGGGRPGPPEGYFRREDDYPRHSQRGRGGPPHGHQYRSEIDYHGYPQGSRHGGSPPGHHPQGLRPQGAPRANNGAPYNYPKEQGGPTRGYHDHPDTRVYHDDPRGISPHPPPGGSSIHGYRHDPRHGSQGYPPGDPQRMRQNYHPDSRRPRCPPTGREGGLPHPAPPTHPGVHPNNGERRRGPPMDDDGDPSFIFESYTMNGSGEGDDEGGADTVTLIRAYRLSGSLIPFGVISLLCFFPLGIPALVYAIHMRDARKEGNMVAARHYQRVVRILGGLAMTLGIFLFVGIGILVALSQGQKIASDIMSPLIPTTPPPISSSTTSVF